MQLWILRHGDAERETRHDPDRALTERGERDATAVGIWLAGVAPAALTVIASPYQRAQQTARAALGAFPGKTLTSVDWLTPDVDPRHALRELAELRVDAALLVSHQPLVSALCGLLVSGDYRAGPPLHTASLVELELDVVGAGCARLLSLRNAPDYRQAAS